VFRDLEAVIYLTAKVKASLARIQRERNRKIIAILSHLSASRLHLKSLE